MRRDSLWNTVAFHIAWSFHFTLMDAHDAKWLGAGLEPTRIFCLVAGTILVGWQVFCSKVKLTREYRCWTICVHWTKRYRKFSSQIPTVLELMASLKVNLVWKRRLGNVATLLFLVNRYIPYVYVFMAFEGKASPCSTQNADCTAF